MFFVSSHGLFAKSLSPTDFTDLHRCEGAFKRVHLSQVHQPSKIDILPQISQIYTDVMVRRI